MSKEMPVGNYLVNSNKRRITIKDPETTAQEFHDWLKEWWIAGGMAAYPIPVTVEEIKDNSPFMAGYYLRVLSGWIIEGLVIDGEQKDYKSGDLIFLKKSKYTVEISNKSNNDDGKLSPKQIKSWRRVLCGMIGPYAMLMPEEEIQAFRDKMQIHIDNIKTEQQIFDASQKISDWACDCGIDDEGNTIEQTNGGSEHLIFLDGKYYTVVTEVGGTKVYKGTLDEVIPSELESDHFMLKMINEWKPKVTNAK